VFHEITKSAIAQAFAQPRSIDYDLVRAQEARSVLDKLAGFTLSPVLWRFVSPGISAGRVQSCGLKLIAEVSQSLVNLFESYICKIHTFPDDNFAVGRSETNY
jgi:DNA topoisomerase-1